MQPAPQPCYRENFEGCRVIRPGHTLRFFAAMVCDTAIADHRGTSQVIAEASGGEHRTVWQGHSCDAALAMGRLCPR